MTQLTKDDAINKAHQKTRFARLLAVQGIYQVRHSDISVDEVILDTLLVEHQSLMDRLGFDHRVLPNKSLYQIILKNYPASEKQLINLIKGHLPSQWPFHRLDPVLIAILMAASIELLHSTTPNAVIVSEYVDVAHSFFSGKEPSFINAVLDAIAKDVRS